MSQNQKPIQIQNQAQTQNQRQTSGVILPPELEVDLPVFRSMGDLSAPGLLGCGFMRKEPEDSSVHVRFPHFGAVYLLRGRGVYRTAQGAETTLIPGCLFFRIPGELHSTLVEQDSGWLECFVAFGTLLYRGFEAMNLLPRSGRVVYPGLDIPLAQRWLRSARRLQTAGQSELAGCLVECQDLLFSLLRGGNNTEPGDYRGIVEQAADLLIQDRWAQEGLEHIAGEVGVSYSLLRRIFPRYTGVSMSQFRIRHRVDRARSLLLASRLTPKQIAQHLGYPDVTSFSRQFRQVTQLTPGQFRRLG